MTTRYVGPGGDNASNGLTWATRKLTLNGVEDTPVAAGDTVWVGAGTYRETLVCDVSGTAGNPITYNADYDGSHTDGVGGLARITGSDDDRTATRTNAISASTRSYRTFNGFLLDMCTGSVVSVNAGTDWTIKNCVILPVSSVYGVLFVGGSSDRSLVNNCFIWGQSGAGQMVGFSHTSTANDTASVVSNCVLLGGAYGVYTAKVGGITVRNCAVLNAGTRGIAVITALASGQVLTVNNCIVRGCGTRLYATTTAEFVDDCNDLYSNGTDRTNVTAGANSLPYAPNFDMRWFFQLLNSGAGPSSVKQLLSMFDLASYSQLLNVAGTSPTATDMRGTGTIGGVREWGALEYDATLKIAGAAAGGILINPGLSGGLR